MHDVAYDGTQERIGGPKVTRRAQTGGYPLGSPIRASRKMVRMTHLFARPATAALGKGARWRAPIASPRRDVQR